MALMSPPTSSSHSAKARRRAKKRTTPRSAPANEAPTAAAAAAAAAPPPPPPPPPEAPAPSTGADPAATDTRMSPLAMQRMQRLHNLRVQTDFSVSAPAAPPVASPPSPRATASAVVAMEPRSTRPHVFRLSDFLYKEVFGVHDIRRSDGVHHERVHNFLVVPLNTEQLFAFGVLLALDSFLYVFTYLPLRILFACGCAVTSSFHARVFRRTHFYDLMVAVILAVGTSVLWRVDMSRVYHAIRGQAMIKLYIFDRLFSSLGQDVLDSLYYTARFQPRRVLRMAMDFLVAIVYVVLHALLLFAQVVTINVAINSSNTSLLTLLISNNFAELKSCVFKKFEEQNLFQISCSDIVERFKLLLIIGLILLQSNVRDVAYGITMVMLAEMVIDWLKHAFITKFNQIPPSVYSKFITILCRDLTGWRNEDTILDHTHHVSRRLGLVSLPLACVVLRMLGKWLHAAVSLDAVALPLLLSLALAAFLCLTAFKTLLSLALMIYACRSGRLDDTRPKSPRAVRQLESIQRYKF
ncbi:hypothetical protein P43SY_008636 [Pythium insidiosum]|uniref:Uncharacterized protein n=1 Tax=Pythium insidiosum TaxID=114742 RepID=A0AAD5LYP4_PYTIN|nr:hypothetical protein P43SY_008636 [Pythium insidiosum]